MYESLTDDELGAIDGWLAFPGSTAWSDAVVARLVQEVRQGRASIAPPAPRALALPDGRLTEIDGEWRARRRTYDELPLMVGELQRWRAYQARLRAVMATSEGVAGWPETGTVTPWSAFRGVFWEDPTP